MRSRSSRAGTGISRSSASRRWSSARASAARWRVWPPPAPAPCRCGCAPPRRSWSARGSATPRSRRRRGEPPSSSIPTRTSTPRPTIGATSLECSRSAPSRGRSESRVADMVTVRLNVNGVAHEGRCEPRKLLVDFIREDLGLTGTHVGCEHGICGACTILFNGEAARSCIMLAVQADGAELATVEGLMRDGKLHPLQEAFREHHGLQCGFCTPGMLMTALDFLRTNPSPSDREIREGISAVLCRCTGYQGIVNAVRTGEDIARAAKPVRAESKTPNVKTTSFPPLALGKVRHVGEAIAMIAAESRYVAEDAVERLVVDYEPLPIVRDTDEALAPGSPVLHEEAGTNLLVSREFARGDVDGALAGAALVVRERFRFHRHTPVCMENRGCLADYTMGSETLTLRSSAQCPGLVRDILTDLLGMPEHQIRVIATDVGGGFGAKASLYPEEIATCVMARRLGRPEKGIG